MLCGIIDLDRQTPVRIVALHLFLQLVIDVKYVWEAAPVATPAVPPWKPQNIPKRWKVPIVFISWWVFWMAQ